MHERQTNRNQDDRTFSVPPGSKSGRSGASEPPEEEGERRTSSEESRPIFAGHAGSGLLRWAKGGDTGGSASPVILPVRLGRKESHATTSRTFSACGLMPVPHTVSLPFFHRPLPGSTAPCRPLNRRAAGVGPGRGADPETLPTPPTSDRPSATEEGCGHEGLPVIARVFASYVP